MNLIRRVGPTYLVCLGMGGYKGAHIRCWMEHCEVLSLLSLSSDHTFRWADWEGRSVEMISNGEGIVAGALLQSLSRKGSPSAGRGSSRMICKQQNWESELLKHSVHGLME